MRNILKLLAAVLLLAVTVQAAEPYKLAPYSYWSGGTTNGSSTLSWVIVPAHSSVKDAIPVVTCADAQCDKLAGKLQSYRILSVATVTFTNSTVSIPVTTTNTPGINGFTWNSGTVIIRHMLTDQYEKRTLATSGGATNVEVSAAPYETTVPGDLLYYATATGGASFSVATNGMFASGGLAYVRREGPALMAGQPGMPLLLEIDSTGAVGAVNNVTVRYEPSNR